MVFQRSQREAWQGHQLAFLVPSGAWCDSWVCPGWGQELNSRMLTGPFQLRRFYDSVNSHRSRFLGRYPRSVIFHSRPSSLNHISENKGYEILLMKAKTRKGQSTSALSESALTYATHLAWKLRFLQPLIALLHHALPEFYLCLLNILLLPISSITVTHFSPRHFTLLT